MDDKSNYVPSSSLSPTHGIKYPSDIGSGEESLDSPRQEASYYAAVLKAAISYDASRGEWFAFAMEEEITQAVHAFLFNTVSRKTAVEQRQT